MRPRAADADLPWCVPDLELLHGIVVTDGSTRATASIIVAPRLP
jgi:hypothetical protein